MFDIFWRRVSLGRFNSEDRLGNSEDALASLAIVVGPGELWQEGQPILHGTVLANFDIFGSNV